jgi:hypothetical protein
MTKSERAKRKQNREAQERFLKSQAEKGLKKKVYWVPDDPAAESLAEKSIKAITAVFLGGDDGS